MSLGACIEEFLQAVHNGKFDEAKSVAREYSEKQGYRTCQTLAETAEKAKRDEELRNVLLKLTNLWYMAKRVNQYRGNLVGLGRLPQELAKLVNSYYVVLNEVIGSSVSDKGVLVIKKYVEALLDNIIGEWDISTRVSLIAALTVNTIAVSSWDEIEKLREEFIGLINELVEAKLDEIKSRLASIEDIRRKFDELKKALEEVEMVRKAFVKAGSQGAASSIAPKLMDEAIGAAVRLAERSMRQLNALERALGALRDRLLALDESQYNVILGRLGQVAARTKTLETLLDRLGIRSRAKHIPGISASWAILGFAVDYVFEVKRSMLKSVEHRLRILSAYQGTAEVTWLYHESLSPGTPSIAVVHLLVPKRSEEDSSETMSLGGLLDLIRTASKAYVVMREYIDEQQVEVIDAVIPEKMREDADIVYHIIKHIVSRGAAMAALVAAVGERGEYVEEKCISLNALEKLVKKVGDDAKSVLDELRRESFRYGLEFDEAGSRLCVRLASL